MTARRRISLRSRLVIGNLLLIVTALTTTWAVVTLSGPPLFRNHIEQGQPLAPGVLDRAEQAFHLANIVEILLATVIAFVLTLGLSVFITRPIARIVTAMAATAARLKAGSYTARLPDNGAIEELAMLASTINGMADTIQHTEATRQRMLTDLAHEMRTPLATVDGFLEAIQDGVESADETTISILRGQIHKLTRLADDVKAISAADEGRLHLRIRPASLNEIVQDAVDAMRPAYTAKDVTLRVNPAPPTIVSADRHRIGQVVTNLLNNALRHTPPSGQVTIDLAATGGTAALTVNDTGEGIPAEHLPHVFERFYRAHPDSDRRNQGSGVGLTISRSIITAHAGTISLDSPGPGQGTVVRVTLPAATAGPAARMDKPTR
jgi:signal transduction histidine kinase